MNSVRASFNKASLTYDANCKLQYRTAKQLIHLVQQYSNEYDTILDLGCGTGIASVIAKSKLQHEIFFALDIADDLLAIASKRLQIVSSCILADFDVLPIKKNSINLCLANMSLHWSRNLTNTLQGIYSSLTTGGLLAIALPTADTFSELTSAINNTGCSNFLNSFPDETQLKNALRNYKIIHLETQTITRYFSNIYTLLKSMQAIGSSCLNKKQKLVSRTELDRVDNYFHYKNHLPQIPLTYKISYYIAAKS